MTGSVEKRKKKLIEEGPGFNAGISGISENLNSKTITAGIVATIFGCTGPALIIIDSATRAGFNEVQIVSWLFGVYFFGGLLGILLSLYYKLPLCGAWSIPGAALLGTALVGVPYNAAAGAFIMAGFIVLLVGLSGMIGKIMRWLPLPIIMAMIAGAMLRFGTGIIHSIFMRDAETGVFESTSLIIGLATMFGFLIMSKISNKISPVLSALVLGFIAALMTGETNFGADSFGFIAPGLVMPSFQLNTVLSISLPLAIMVIGAENSQAIGVMLSQKYTPPANSMTIFSGIGGMVAGMFGGANANIAGPMTAICSSKEAGDKLEGRYVSAVVNGISFGVFGLFAGWALGLIRALPGSLISILAGVAMINVLVQSFDLAFSTGKYKIGAFFALSIAASGLTIMKIGAPFWAMLFGVIISLLADSHDWEAERKYHLEAAERDLDAMISHKHPTT